MVKSRNIHFLMLFSFLFVSQCNGMCVAKAVCKKSGRILKYGAPVVVVALIAYNIYNYFFDIRRIDRNVKDVKRGIEELKRDTAELKKGMKTANQKLLVIEDGVSDLKQDTQELKDGNKKLQKLIEKFEQETGANFKKVLSRIDGVESALLKRIDKQEVTLSDLIMLVETNMRKDIKEVKKEMGDGFAQSDKASSERIAGLERRLEGMFEKKFKKIMVILLALSQKEQDSA